MSNCPQLSSLSIFPRRSCNPATKSYVPLTYESFLTRIEKQLAVEGMTIKDEKLALGNNGQRFFGLLQLEMPNAQHRDYGCVLGLRNSYDKSMSTGVCIGASVFVCDNLSFQGEVTFQRKHTVNLRRDLSRIITETIALLPKKFAEQSETFECYRQTEITDRQAHDLVIRLFDNEAIHTTEIPSVLREWRTPRHSEFAQDGKTAWRLFNATTGVIKSDLGRLPARTRASHEVLDEPCGLNAEMQPQDRDETVIVV